MGPLQHEHRNQLDESFFAEGYNLAHAFLFKEFSKENLFAAQRRLFTVVDELTASFLGHAADQGSPTECRMGCSFCCHQTVLASPPELFYLADFLQKKFREDALQVILDRAKEKHGETAKLRMDKLLKYKKTCPLLHPTGGYCRAYQARPIACRIYLSKSVKSCENDLNTPNDDSVFPDLFEWPLRAGRMLNEGFLARVRKGREDSLQMTETIIESGILKASETGNLAKWISGKNSFPPNRL